MKWFSKSKKKSPKVVNARTTDPVVLSLELQHVSRIPYEITKVKKIHQQDGSIIEKRVPIKWGRISRSAKYIFWPKMKSLYWNNLSELSYEERKKREKLIFDIDYAEPFDSQGSLKPSETLEHALIDQSFDDYSEVVATTGFELTQKHIMVMLAVALAMLPLGFSLHTLFGIGPNTIVHWTTSFGGLK